MSDSDDITPQAQAFVRQGPADREGLHEVFLGNVSLYDAQPEHIEELRAEAWTFAARQRGIARQRALTEVLDAVMEYLQNDAHDGTDFGVGRACGAADIQALVERMIDE